MFDRRTIPPGVVVVVAQELAAEFTHTKLDAVFRIAGAAGDPPIGNKVDKCSDWLMRTNKSPEPGSEPLEAVIAEYMELDYEPDSLQAKGRERVSRALAKSGLTYTAGKIVDKAHVAAPTRSLETVLRDRDLPSVNKEFERALANVELDPPAAVTAACAVIEAFCRTHIEDNRLQLPAVQDLGSLWKVVRKDLKLDNVGDFADDDIRRILSGLASIADGVAALRTHAGSAHGKGRNPFKILPRHARLAVHAAHTLVLYLVERGETVKR